jgi:hypothetical protein
LGVTVNVSAGAHSPLPSYKHILEALCKLGFEQVPLIYMATSTAELFGPVILSKRLSAMLFEVTEKYVMGEFPVLVQTTFPPIEVEIV